MTAENVQDNTIKHTNTCYFTMVARDSEGTPMLVPPLILETDEDLRRFVTAAERKKLRSQMHERMTAYKDEFTVDEAVRAAIQDERCSLKLRGATPDASRSGA